jgi:hypothetical protein
MIPRTVATNKAIMEKMIREIISISSFPHIVVAKKMTNPQTTKQPISQTPQL